MISFFDDTCLNSNCEKLYCKMPTTNWLNYQFRDLLTAQSTVERKNWQIVTWKSPPMKCHEKSILWENDWLSMTPQCTLGRPKGLTIWNLKPYWITVFSKIKEIKKEHTLSNKINIIYQSYNSSLLLLSMIKTPYINILFILLISWISKKCNKEHSELLLFKNHAWCHTKNNVNC